MGWLNHQPTGGFVQSSYPPSSDWPRSTLLTCSSGWWWCYVFFGASIETSSTIRWADDNWLVERMTLTLPILWKFKLQIVQRKMRACNAACHTVDACEQCLNFMSSHTITSRLHVVCIVPQAKRWNVSRRSGLLLCASERVLLKTKMVKKAARCSLHGIADAGADEFLDLQLG